MQKNHTNTHPTKDEWFYFLDGEVVGPATYRSLFFLPAVSQNGIPIMVRKKGYKKWYPISDLPGFEGLPARNLLDYQVDEDRRAFSEFFAEKMQELSVMHQITLSQYKDIDPNLRSMQSSSAIHENSSKPRDNIITRSTQNIKKRAIVSEPPEQPQAATVTSATTTAVETAADQEPAPLAEKFDSPVISTHELSNVKIDPEPLVETPLAVPAQQTVTGALNTPQQDRPQKSSIMQKMRGLWRTRAAHPETPS